MGWIEWRYNVPSRLSPKCTWLASSFHSKVLGMPKPLDVEKLLSLVRVWMPK